jgi:hypothetical protein
VHATGTKAVRVSLLPDAVRREAFAEASRFRDEFYECLTARREELFEPADAVLCADGAVKSPVDLTLLPEHHRGHGAMYGGLNHGRIDTGREQQHPRQPVNPSKPAPLATDRHVQAVRHDHTPHRRRTATPHPTDHQQPPTTTPGRRRNCRRYGK